MSRTGEDLERSSNRRPDRIDSLTIEKRSSRIRQLFHIQRHHPTAALESSSRELSPRNDRPGIAIEAVPQETRMSNGTTCHVRSQWWSGIPTKSMATRSRLQPGSPDRARWHVDSTSVESPKKGMPLSFPTALNLPSLKLKGVSPRPAPKEVQCLEPLYSSNMAPNITEIQSVCAVSDANFPKLGNHPPENFTSPPGTARSTACLAEMVGQETFRP